MRILVQFIAIGAFDDPSKGNITDNVRTDEHTLFARKLAQESVVLLKNEDKALPLNEHLYERIAVIGDVAHEIKLVCGGGSGHVNDDYTVTSFDGIKARAKKNAIVEYINSKDIAAAVKLAKSADTVIIVTGANTGEGWDRYNITLYGEDDKLINAIADNHKNVIVIVHNPASVTLPWVGRVKACIAAFYPGEQNGHALASIIFGDVNPSGKLPITIPKTETQNSVNTPEQFPGVNKVVTYSEKLLVGYRWNNQKNIEPEFHFGHGLSYTTFEYSNLKVTKGTDSITVEFVVTNTGFYEGKEVSQLYITFPDSAGEPPKILKGFEKVSLKVFEEKQVKLQLKKKDLSIWCVVADDWKLIDGEFKINVGSSVKDIRLSSKYQVKNSSFGRKQKLEFLS